MKMTLIRKIGCLLAAALVAGAGLIASCSNHIDDLILPEKISPADVNVGIEVDFKTLVLGYDSDTNTATAAGLGDEATYVWSIDGNSAHPALSQNGAVCTLDVSKLTVGVHRLLVVGTLDGVDYSADCTVTVTKE